MKVLPNGALDISGSLYLTVGYSLKDEDGGFGIKSNDWLAKVRGWRLTLYVYGTFKVGACNACKW